MSGLVTTRAAVALLAGVWALLLALYWIKPVRRRVVVSFMQLWDAVLPSETSARWFGRLGHVGSLLIMLAIGAALVFALHDPHGTHAVTVHTRLLLIDVGQHMQANDVPPSRMAEARRLAERLIATKSPSETWLVAQLGTEVKPLAVPSRQQVDLVAGLRELSATDGATNFDAAVAFAVAALSEQPAPTLCLISDGAFDVSTSALATLEHHGIALEQLSVGTSRRNVGIRSFNVRRSASDTTQAELLIEIENAADHAESLDLTIYGDERALEVAQFELPPHAVSRRVISQVAGYAERFEARLSLTRGPDALAADDRAYAVLPPLRPKRILLVSDGNRYLEAGLLVDPSWKVSVVAPAQYHGTRGWDLVVFDRYTPELPPGLPSVYIAPRPTNSAAPNPFAVRGFAQRPSFDSVKLEHPLLRRLALRDVNMVRALRVIPQPEDEILAAAGDVPLIVSGVRAGQRFVALTFDVRESDLPLRVAWPLLCAHIVEWLSPTNADYRPGLTVGNARRLTVTDNDQMATVRAPDGRAQPIPLRKQQLSITPARSGFYRFDAGAERSTWAATRDPGVSVAIAPRRIAGATESAARSATPRLGAPLWSLLLAAAWLAVLLEWFTYQRRWTA